MSNASRRGAVLATTAVGGLTLAALVLPQLAGTLRPTALGLGLLTLVLSLATVCAQRLVACFSRRSALEQALRTYPPERLADADWSMLGVFPAPVEDGEGAGCAYQTRADGADAQLRAALATSTCVIVHGPAGEGKTRAAAQAARELLGDLPVLIPFDADGLRWLADNDFDLKVPRGPKQLCLWLDNLDRLIEALDTRTLGIAQRRRLAVRVVRRLAGRRHLELVVVATIRTDRWNQLLGGSDQASEVARQLANCGTLVPIGDRLPAAAAEPAPGLPAAGPSAVAPAPEPAAANPPPRVEALRRAVGARLATTSLPAWFDVPLGLLICVLVAVGVLMAFLYRGRLLVQPPSLSDQIAAITSQMEADAGGGHVVISDRVWLHSTEAESWVVVVQHGATHDASLDAGRHGGLRSDELRVYDVHDGWLDPELRFRPVGAGGDSVAQWQSEPTGSPTVGYLLNQGTPELIAGYAFPGEDQAAVLPFGIQWQDDHYAMEALTRQKPALSTLGLKRATVAYRQRAYQRQITMRNALATSAADPSRTTALTGFRVQAFAIVQKPSIRLLSAYLTHTPEWGHVQPMELHASQIRTGSLRLTACTHLNVTCSAPAGQEDVQVPPDKDPGNALVDAWPLVQRQWFSPLRVSLQSN